MAVTSIWRINGWLGNVVIYVENPEKTDNPKFYETSEKGAQGLSDVINYAVNSEKTQKVDDENTELYSSFVSGINCHPSTARDEMLAVKRRFGKEDGTAAYHGYQSFAPGEATPEMAHEIGIKLAERLWGNKYQVIVATHLDTENHLHNHFVVNTVSFIDGIKYYRSAKDYHDMQTASDELCKQYGLSVIENPRDGTSKHYGEWRAEAEQRPTWRGIIRVDVDEVIRQSMTERQFFDNLRKRGYEVKIGKDISVRPPNKDRFVRLARNFGDDYTIDGIRQRILSQSRAERPLPEAERKTQRYPVKGNIKKAKKVKGFRALYYHYCYLLGIFPRDRPQNRKRLHFLLREDLIKMDDISKEARLLSRNHIDTAEELFSYRSSCKDRLKTLIDELNVLFRKRRTVSVKSDDTNRAEVQGQIDSLTSEIKKLRQEVRLCEDIRVRSGVMKDKIKTVREDEKEKEAKRDEQLRRCGRTNRANES